jgi:hypothetical protein
MVHRAPGNKLQPSNPLSVFQILRSKAAARPVVSTTRLRRGTALCNSIQAVPRERRVSEWSSGVPRSALTTALAGNSRVGGYAPLAMIPHILRFRSASVAIGWPATNISSEPDLQRCVDTVTHAIATICTAEFEIVSRGRSQSRCNYFCAPQDIPHALYRDLMASVTHGPLRWPCICEISPLMRPPLSDRGLICDVFSGTFEFMSRTKSSFEFLAAQAW